LLPEPYNTKLLTLLYHLAEWQAFAKLRMHTEHTLPALDTVTRVLGNDLRSFRQWTGTAFTIKALPQEINNKKRRTQKKKKKIQIAITEGTSEAEIDAIGISQKQKQKQKQKNTETSNTSANGITFNLLTYKLHALGDYVKTIRLFGTTDSYSTQIVSH
jgi:hypothetical protein